MYFRSYSELLFKFGAISSQEYVWKITVFYSDLVYKLRRVKGVANFIYLVSKIVNPLRRHQYDPPMIERTRGIVLGPFTALYKFLKRCTLTNNAVRNIWPALSKLPPRRRDRLNLVPSDCEPGLLQPFELNSLPDWRSIAYSYGCH